MADLPPPKPSAPLDSLVLLASSMTNMRTEAAVPGAGGPSPQLAALLDASLSVNTRRAYLGALERLDARLDGAKLTDAWLAEYVTQLHGAGQAPASIQLVVSAVRCRARLEKAESPVGPLTTRALAGIRREGRDRGRGQARGVDWPSADAAAAIAAADRCNPVAGCRDAALISLASDALLRVSEVAALTVSDLEWDSEGSGRLWIGASKTDQEGTGAVLYLRRVTMRRVRRWLKRLEASEGPLFRRVFRGGRVGEGALTQQSVREIIRHRCVAAGVEGRVTGHSLRVGATQAMIAAGAGLVEAQTAGRWTSPAMPGHYARAAEAARGPVARLRPDDDPGAPKPEARSLSTP